MSDSVTCIQNIFSQSKYVILANEIINFDWLSILNWMMDFWFFHYCYFISIITFNLTLNTIQHICWTLKIELHRNNIIFTNNNRNKIIQVVFPEKLIFSVITALSLFIYFLLAVNRYKESDPSMRIVIEAIRHGDCIPCTYLLAFH